MGSRRGFICRMKVSYIASICNLRFLQSDFKVIVAKETCIVITEISVIFKMSDKIIYIYSIFSMNIINFTLGRIIAIHNCSIFR